MGAGGAIYAYNGSLYQWAIPGREALSFSKQCRHPNLYWGANPILVPYSWLATGVVNWSDLKDRERWLAQFDKARYEGKKTENNKIFDVVSFPYTPNDENPFAIEQIHVYFSKETGYYPLKSVYYAKNKQLLGHVEVLQYTLLDIDGQKTVFPLVVTGENSKFTITIDESSIKVNQHIDEDLFTLSPSMAKDVYDYDEELKKLEPFSDTSDVVNTSGNTVPPSRWTWKRISIIVIADVIIIAILLILWYWLRKKK
jgi:hypothetical protein